MRRAFFLFSIAAFSVAACSGEPPGQYPVSAGEAYQRLSANDFSAFMRNRQCGVLIQVERDGLPGTSVTWTIKSSDREMLHFTAKLTPVDAKRTRVAVEISKDENGREAYDGSQFYRRPAVKQPVRPAIEEQIAAILEGRAFSHQNLTRSSGGLSAPPQGAFRDSVCDVQRGRLEEMGEPFSVDDPIE